MMESGVEIVVVDFPEEVIREILSRLPVKSLLKFRCVSKSWLSLISTHQFAKAHLNISSKKNDRLILGSNVKKKLYTCSISSVSELSTDTLYSLDDENPVVDYVELDCPPFIGVDANASRRIVGSCNGLVCFSFSGNEIILLNPATRKFKKLPHSGTRFDGRFDGCWLEPSHGFGYDHVHDDYKVVEFSKSNQVKVYSSRSNSWKVLDNWSGGKASSWPGQFLNGAIHWSVWDLSKPPKWFIVAQDIVSDEFVKLPFPNIEVDSDVLIEVKVEILDGCVALCCWYYLYVDVWVMKEYGLGESWVKQVCIPDSPHVELPQPILFFGDGKVLIKCRVALRIYDSTNPQPRQLCLRYIDNVEEAIVTTYFESLVSPNLDDADVFAEV